MVKAFGKPKLLKSDDVLESKEPLALEKIKTTKTEGPTLDILEIKLE
jgi:hypothetical protein